MSNLTQSEEAGQRNGSVGHEPAGGLEVRSLSKVFPGTVALDEVSLGVGPGEIHALAGGNGSGKSTLIKIVAGVYQGDPGGTIRVGGTEVAADKMSAETAHQAGVRVVHQGSGVFPDLTVAENIALGYRFPTGPAGWVRWRRLRKRAAELIERFEIAATPDTLMRELPVAAQTEVAIARALQDQAAIGSGVLIIDEATASLPEHEVELLFASLRRYAQAGQSIVYVTHRLDEILDLSDHVSVLRDGRHVGTFETETLDESRLFELIVGRPREEVAGKSTTRSAGPPVLEIRGLTAGPLRDVNLTLRRGEILGIAGLLGSGRSEILRAVFGSLKVDAGEIRLDGDRVDFHHPDDAMKAGIAFVAEDRSETAFEDQTVYQNLTIASLGKYWTNAHISRGDMRKDARDLMRQFGVKAASEGSLMDTLSGGNQQKVILARWLARGPRLLLLDEPTHGVDIGARAEIYAMVRDAVENGASAVLVASDFEELADVAHRAVVLRRGTVVDSVDGERLEAHYLTELSYARQVDDD